MYLDLSKTGKMIPLSATIRTVFRLFVIIAWGIFLLPGYHLFTYTSIQATVWDRYSPAYASLLLLYFSLVLLWPLFLALPGRFIIPLAQYLLDVRSRRGLHIRFGLTALAIALFAVVVTPLWRWGQDPILQLALVLLGGWVAAQPIIWDWTTKGWQLSYFLALIGRLHEWIFQDFYIWLRPVVVVAVILLSALLAYKAPQRLLLVVCRNWLIRSPG